MAYGITPDFLVVRADTEIPDDLLQKIAKSSGLSESHVIASPTLDSIYRVPLEYARNRVGQTIAVSLGLSERTPDIE
jgi:CTP synthase